jgi:hypothetical protein
MRIREMSIWYVPWTAWIPFRINIIFKFRAGAK